MGAKTIELVAGRELHDVCRLFPEMEAEQLAELAEAVFTDGEMAAVRDTIGDEDGHVRRAEAKAMLLREIVGGGE